MSVTYTANFLVLWLGMVGSLYFKHPQRLRSILFLLLPLPFLVWGGAGVEIAAGVTESWAGGWGIMLLLSAAMDVAKLAGKPYTISISESGIRNEAWPSKSIVAWSEVVKMTFIGGDIAIFRNGGIGGFFVPKSAFADDSQAQQFYEQAVNYWLDATGRFRGT